ncbi:hypothetical protein ACFSVJ_22335 [Prauserella oleivorans]
MASCGRGVGSQFGQDPDGSWRPPSERNEWQSGREDVGGQYQQVVSATQVGSFVREHRLAPKGSQPSHASGGHDGAVAPPSHAVGHRFRLLNPEDGPLALAHGPQQREVCAPPAPVLPHPADGNDGRPGGQPDNDTGETEPHDVLGHDLAATDDVHATVGHADQPVDAHRARQHQQHSRPECSNQHHRG